MVHECAILDGGVGLVSSGEMVDGTLSRYTQATVLQRIHAALLPDLLVLIRSKCWCLHSKHSCIIHFVAKFKLVRSLMH